MTSDELCTLAVRLLDTLIELHDLSPPLIHGALSPRKVLVTPKGALVFLGFGDASRPLATKIEDEGEGYTAPERAHSAASIRSDLFGVGAILFALAAGRAPATLTYRDGAPELDAGLSGELRRFLERALCLDPDERFASASEARAVFSSRTTALAQRAPTALGAPRGPASPTMGLAVLGALLELVLIFASPTLAAAFLPLILGGLYVSYRVERRAQGCRRQAESSSRALKQPLEMLPKRGASTRRKRRRR
jgi:serine/threonine protein kinase